MPNTLDNKKYPLLEGLLLPQGIASLSLEEKYQLAEEIRSRIIEVTSCTGGHLASSLGAVDITIALLATMDYTHDRVVWDVGHQAYAWKIATGRNEVFDTLRTYNGISGFLRGTESAYDHFGAGHASTSISAALGIALAMKHKGIPATSYAIIGDGSLTGGQALEALNQAGLSNTKLTIILNDNTFSISSNVGALSRFVSRSLSNAPLRRIKDSLKRTVGKSVVEYLRKGERSFKAFMTPGMLFEALQINYIGPIDGHDIESIEEHLALAQAQDRSVLLHIITEKGKGFTPAEQDPIRFHGVGKFCIENGEVIFTKQKEIAPTYTAVFSATICALAKEDTRLFTITAAMPEGTGTNLFQKEFPERFIDVGICEQHAVTMAGGLAREGMRPVVAIYSTFLQRAYDQILHDICIQNLPVTFCIDRAGFVGEDGATHHGIYDIAYLRHMPAMSILIPRNENELQHALYTAIGYNAPIAIRYPKGIATGVECDTEYKILPTGVGELLKDGRNILIIGIGTILNAVVSAVQRIEESYAVSCAIFDARWCKPLPKEQLCMLAKEYSICILVEEGTACGGFSSAVCELFADEQCMPKHITRIAIPDTFIEHGTREELLQEVGLDVEGIYKTILCCIEEYVV